MAKGGYQRQRLQQKKEAERRARKRARRQRQAIQWIVGVIVFALIFSVIGLAVFGGKKKPVANPSATPSPTVSASPSPSPTVTPYLIPGCTKPSSAKPSHKTFSKPPAMKIDKKKTYLITLKTTCGPIVWKLNAKLAPTTVNNIVFLANQHFYDNTVFHRIQVVLPSDPAALQGGTFAIVQGGDPTATGSGGPGYQYNGEKPPSTTKYTRGTLAMANSGDPTSDGSQFFIVVNTWSSLPANYTVFGTVTGADSFKTLDRMIKARGASLGQYGINPVPSIKIISATVTVQ